MDMPARLGRTVVTTLMPVIALGLLLAACAVEPDYGPPAYPYGAPYPGTVDLGFYGGWGGWHHGWDHGHWGHGPGGGHWGHGFAGHGGFHGAGGFHGGGGHGGGGHR